MKFATGLPMTDHERAAEAEARRMALDKAVLRRIFCRGQNYYREPTDADRKFAQRVVGESDQG